MSFKSTDMPPAMRSMSSPLVGTDKCRLPFSDEDTKHMIDMIEDRR